MKLPRAPLAALLLILASLAGCVERDQASVDPPVANDPSSDPPASGGLGQFVLEGPTLLPASGEERSLYEDDALTIAYTLRVPQDAPTTTGFVTLLVNGEVARSENLQLQPGEGREFEHTLPTLRNHTAVKAEVRALQARGEAEADVHKWPRVGERREYGGFAMAAYAWAQDLPNGTTVVNATLENLGGTFSTMRIKLLCADATHAISEVGVVEPPMPVAGQPLVTDLRLPLCPEGSVTYGMQATLRDGVGQPAVYARVLFVPAGWPETQA